MAEIDEAIEFMNDLACIDEDKDIVAYILRQLIIRKKEVEKELSGAGTPKELQLINISR